MYETRRDRLLEQKRRMYRSVWVKKLGTAGDIFRSLYGCDPLRWMDIQIAKGTDARKAEAEMHKRLDRIREEELRQFHESEKIRIAYEKNDGFMDASGEENPFADSG